MESRSSDGLRQRPTPVGNAWPEMLASSDLSEASSGNFGNGRGDTTGSNGEENESCEENAGLVVGTGTEDDGHRGSESRSNTSENQSNASENQSIALTSACRTRASKLITSLALRCKPLWEVFASDLLVTRGSYGAKHVFSLLSVIALSACASRAKIGDNVLHRQKCSQTEMIETAIDYVFAAIQNQANNVTSNNPLSVNTMEFRISATELVSKTCIEAVEDPRPLIAILLVLTVTTSWLQAVAVSIFDGKFKKEKIVPNVFAFVVLVSLVCIVPVGGGDRLLTVSLEMFGTFVTLPVRILIYMERPGRGWNKVTELSKVGILIVAWIILMAWCYLAISCDKEMGGATLIPSTLFLLEKLFNEERNRMTYLCLLCCIGYECMILYKGYREGMELLVPLWSIISFLTSYSTNALLKKFFV